MECNYKRLNSFISVPLTPKPVILNNEPAGDVVGSSNTNAEVVTNSSSRLGPPKATDVTCLAGISISKSIFPILRFNKSLLFKYSNIHSAIN